MLFGLVQNFVVWDWVNATEFALYICTIGSHKCHIHAKTVRKQLWEVGLQAHHLYLGLLPLLVGLGGSTCPQNVPIESGGGSY